MTPQDPRKLTFVCEVVSETEYKLRWLFAILLHKPLRNLALVHEPWADFEVGFPCHHLHIVFLANCLLKMLLALSRLESTPLGICEPVVPGKGDLLSFNERSYGILDV